MGCNMLDVYGEPVSHYPVAFESLPACPPTMCESRKINRLDIASRLAERPTHNGPTIAIRVTRDKEVDMRDKLSRHGFLKLAGMAGLGSVVVPQDLFAQYRLLTPVSVPNPLAAYPNRDWERMYRDIYRHDKR